MKLSCSASLFAAWILFWCFAFRYGSGMFMTNVVVKRAVSRKAQHWTTPKKWAQRERWQQLQRATMTITTTWKDDDILQDSESLFEWEGFVLKLTSGSRDDSKTSEGNGGKKIILRWLPLWGWSVQLKETESHTPKNGVISGRSTEVKGRRIRNVVYI